MRSAEKADSYFLASEYGDPSELNVLNSVDSCLNVYGDQLRKRQNTNST